jgi:efflux transporter, RND family, MFP subunit
MNGQKNNHHYAMNILDTIKVAVLSGVCVLQLIGCKQSKDETETAQSLTVLTVSEQPVDLTETFSASIRGRQDVDIIPQVSGRITRLCVKEGERVVRGQVLAIIDQVPYQAALRTAVANVSAAKARVETARIELNGKQSLFDENVISDYELSVARNQLAVAQAELEQAKAHEADARNNLSYTEIKSPSDGVVGELPYRIGALVSPTIEQPFTVVSDNSEMYAYFSISENKLRQLVARYGSIDRIISEMPAVKLQLNDGSFYERGGKIETISGVVNSTTGAVQIKALFPNPDKELMSGTIGNVVIQESGSEVIVVPMTATVELQDKVIAYRLKNGKAEAAYLTVDRLNDGNNYIVKRGLAAGDTIISEGVGLVKEGMSVTPKTEKK